MNVNNGTRRLISFLVFFLIMIIAIVLSTMEPNVDGDVRVTALDYTAVITDEPDGRGKAVITEVLTFDVRAHSRDYLTYELWRALPEEYVDGAKVEYNVLSVTQLFHDKPPLEYDETPNLYWWDGDYISKMPGYGPGNWHHSKGPYDGYKNWECVLFYVGGLYREKVYFEVVYEMYNASMRYNDATEFYVSLFDGETIRHLTSVKGQLLVPLDIMPRAGNYNAYTYGTNAGSFPFSESTTLNPGYHTFSFELDRSQLRFRPYNRYIEFALIAHGEDKHIFSRHADYNLFIDSDRLQQLMDAQDEYEALPGQYRTKKFTVLASLSAAALAIVFAVSIYDKALKKKKGFYKPLRPVRLYREIPGELDPCFTAALVFSKYKYSHNIKDGYASVMLSLVMKGYIDLVKQSRYSADMKPENVDIIVKHNPAQQASAQHDSAQQNSAQQDSAQHDSAQQNPGSPLETPVPLKPLTETEELYFNLILRYARDNRLSVSTLQQNVIEDYSYSYSFVTNVKEAIRSIGAKLMYFQDESYRKYQKAASGFAVGLTILGILVMLIGNLASYQTRLDLAFGAFFILGGGLVGAAVYLVAVSLGHILYTQAGVDEYAKWRGLYRFLNSNTLMNERTVLELAIWEHYLIYATAFGISKKVIKALNVRCPETSPEAGTSRIIGNPYFRTRRFYMSSRGFRTATRGASINRQTGGGWSSGSGSWGSGYGGGGRGGGGAGGGH